MASLRKLILRLGKGFSIIISFQLPATIPTRMAYTRPNLDPIHSRDPWRICNSYRIVCYIMPSQFAWHDSLWPHTMLSASDWSPQVEWPRSWQFQTYQANVIVILHFASTVQFCRFYRRLYPHNILWIPGWMFALWKKRMIIKNNYTLLNYSRCKL